MVSEFLKYGKIIIFMKHGESHKDKCFRTLTTINLSDKMFFGVNFVNLNSKHFQSMDEAVPQIGFLLLITIIVKTIY